MSAGLGFSLKGGGWTSSTLSDSTHQVTLTILLNLAGVPFDFLEKDIQKSIHPKNCVQSGHFRSKIS